jgi:hypothetical protein
MPSRLARFSSLYVIFRGLLDDSSDQINPTQQIFQATVAEVIFYKA